MMEISYFLIYLFSSPCCKEELILRSVPLVVYSTPSCSRTFNYPGVVEGSGCTQQRPHLHPLTLHRHEKNQFEKFEHFDLIHLWKGLLSKVAFDSLRSNYIKAFHGATKKYLLYEIIVVYDCHFFHCNVFERTAKTFYHH